MKIAELVAELGFDLKGEHDLRRFEAGMKGAESRLTAFAGAVTRIGVAVGSAFAGAMTTLGFSVIKTSAQFEGFETALITLEGSSEKARQSINWIQRFARETPYDLAGVTDAFIRLKSYGIEATDGTLRTLGDAASAMNKPLLAAVEMFADAATFQFERLREFGIVASQKGDQVTFRWDRNGQTLTRTVKKSSDEIRRFLLENFGERFNGAMLRQSKTWEGMIANLGDSWEDFKLRIGRGGFFDTVKGRLADLLDYIGELDSNGTLDRWSKNLSYAFTQAIKSVERFVWGFRKLGEGVADIFNKISGGKIDMSALQGLAGVFALLVRRFMPFTFWLGVGYLLLDDILGYMRGGKSVIGDFIGWIQELTGASEALAQVLAGIVVSLGLLALAKPGLLLKGIGKAAETVAGGKAGRPAPTSASPTTPPVAAGGGGGWMKAFGLSSLTGFVATLVQSLGDTPGDTFEEQVANQSKAREGLMRLFGLDGPKESTGRAHLRTRDDGGRERSLDDFLDGPKESTGTFKLFLDGMEKAAKQITGQAEQEATGIRAAGAAITGALNDVAKAIGGAIVPSATASEMPAPDPARFGGEAKPAMGIEELRALAANVDGALAAMNSARSGAAVQPVLNDNRQDNRQFPVTVNTTVNQTVQQATQAPAAVANAVAKAANPFALDHRRTPPRIISPNPL